MISQFFISRPKFAFIISLAIVIVGLISIYNLPVAQYPDIVPPTVSISTTYPGASAEIVEKTVVSQLEQQINGVKNMIYFSSQSSNDGSASITVSFDIGTDGDINTINTQNRVSIALSKLPEEVKTQGVTVKEKSTEMLMVVNVYSDNDKYDNTFLSNFCSLNMLDEITRIPGVGDAQILGGQPYAMRIWLNPDLMAAHKLITQDVISAIQEQNIQVAAGKIGGAPAATGQKFQYTIKTQGRLSTVEEFENIIIRTDESGASIKIKNLGTVELGASSYSAYGELNGRPSANLAVYQLSGANALTVADSVKTKIEELKKSFPEDIQTSVMYDSTEFVKVSIEEVLITLFIAVALVILVTFIFLQDWRSTLIPTIAIPVSLIGTFAFILALGYTINLITLFGIILAIGIVVDDAIIVIENVNRIMEEENLDPEAATRKSMNQVTTPIIATTLVLLATFIPVTFLPGITGELYRQFAVTIAVSVFISSINALTLSPALCATLLKPGKKKVWLPFRWFNKGFAALTNKYNKCIAFLIRRLALVILGFIILIGASCYLYKVLPTGFVPDEDQGKIVLDIQLPDGAALDRTAEVMKQINDLLQKTPGIKDVLSVIGFSPMTQSTASNVGFAIVILDDWSKRLTPDLQVNSLLKKLNMEFSKMPEADIRALNTPPIPGLGSSGGFEFELQQKGAGDPNKLYSIMNDIIYKANQSETLSQVFSTYRVNASQIFLTVDKDKVKNMDIALTDVYNTLQTYLGSIYVNDFNKFGKTYQVMVQALPQFRNIVQDINYLYTRNNAGEMIPLETLVSTKEVLGPEVINHYNMFQSAKITGSAATGYSSGEAIAEMEKIANETIPSDMTYSWTGTSYQEILAGNMTFIVFGLALIFIYMFLVAQYESWMIAFAVMLSVPVAIFGALAALWVTGIEMNIYAQIGFTLLFGMATKTAILIVEFAKEQRESGKSILKAAEFAANLRFRAVIMTAISFILGVLPLVIATGPSAASRRSLGTAVFGGMISAAIFGTLVVPAFYVIIQKVIEFKFNKSKNEAVK